MNSVLIPVAVAILAVLGARARTLWRAQAQRRRIQMRLKTYAER